MVHTIFLLGGDNNVVPSQGLSVTTGIFEKDANGNSIGLYKDHNIPSDIFYSSLHEPLDWVHTWAFSNCFKST